MQAEKEDENGNTFNITSIATEKKPESVGKRRGYVIPSRYMQKPEQSVLQKRSTPILSTTIVAKGSGAKPKAIKKLGITPKSEPGTKKIQSSTPTGDYTRVQSFEDGNISCISLISKMPIVPTMKTALGPAFNEEGRIPKLKKFTGSPSKLKAKPLRPLQAVSPKLSATVPLKKKAATNDGQDFDLLYASEVLLAYQIHEEKETLEKNVKENLALLWALHLKNCELAERETALVNELREKKHKMVLHDLLTKQKKELQETLPIIKDVREKLSAITNSLDQCQLEIPVKNVKLPENQDDIVNCFQSLNTSLSEILQENQTLSKKLSDVASALPEIRTTLVSTQNAISRSEDLASRLNQLSNKEASVLIQRIQEITLPSMSFQNPKWSDAFKLD